MNAIKDGNKNEFVLNALTTQYQDIMTNDNDEYFKIIFRLLRFIVENNNVSLFKLLLQSCNKECI